LSGTLRPVVDTSLAQEDRNLLAESADGLTAASRPAPPRPRYGGRTWADAGTAVPAATLCGFLPVVAGPFLLGLRAGLTAGAASQILIVASWWWGGAGAFLLVGTALQLAAWSSILAVGCGEGRRQRLARRSHGRYYLAGDFAGGSLRPVLRVSAIDQMLRAQTAVETVMESQVNSDGLLDDVANGVTLPQQEWEIAQALAELSRIGRRLRDVAKDQPSSSRVREAIEPQQQALRNSAASVVRRVDALERYAERVRAADAEYGEWQAVRKLEELSSDTREVLARTVRDDLAISEIDGLMDQRAVHPFQRTLEEARQAGLVLSAPGASEPT